MTISRYLQAGIAACTLLSANAGLAEQRLIYGEAGPNRGARAAATQWFVDEVDRLTGGELVIDVNWGGALFSTKAAVPSIRDGVADLGSVIGVYFPQEMLTYGIADLPLKNPDPWVGMRATDELMRSNEQIIKALADQNLVYVGTYTTSAVQIGCKGEPIKTVADIKGKKVRGVGAYGKAFADLGATPVDMSIYEAYQGLESGLIDCTQTYSYLIEALKFDEVLDNYSFINWGQIGALGIMMNKDAFEALPEAHQQAIQTAGAGLADEFGRIIDDANEASIQMLKEKDIPIYELAEADRDALVDAGHKYIEQWVERANDAGLEGEAILADYRALIDKYTAEAAEQGYPWARN